MSDCQPARPVAVSITAGSVKVTVVPTLPSAALMACATAWVSAVCRSPAMTAEAPRLPARSFATAATNLARSPERGAGLRYPASAGTVLPSSAARASAKASMSALRSRRRWSAIPPVMLNRGSTT